MQGCYVSVYYIYSTGRESWAFGVWTAIRSGIRSATVDPVGILTSWRLRAQLIEVPGFGMCGRLGGSNAYPTMEHNVGARSRSVCKSQALRPQVVVAGDTVVPSYFLAAIFLFVVLLLSS